MSSTTIQSQLAVAHRTHEQIMIATFATYYGPIYCVTRFQSSLWLASVYSPSGDDEPNMIYICVLPFTPEMHVPSHPDVLAEKHVYRQVSLFESGI